MLKVMHEGLLSGRMEQMRTNQKNILLIALAALVAGFCPPADAQPSAFPANPRARVLLEQGRILLEEKRVSEARQVFEEAVRLSPENGLAHFRFAKALNESGEVEQALDEYLIVLKLKPHIRVTKYNIGDCYQSLGRVPDAITFFEQFVKEEPDDALVNMANARIEALKRVRSISGKDDPLSSDYLNAVLDAGGRRMWIQDQLPIKVYISNGSEIADFPAQFNKVALDSLNDWIDTTGGKLSYQLVDESGEASIVLDWTNDPLSVKQGATGAEGGHTDVKWKQSLSDPTGTKQLFYAHVRILVVGNANQKFLADNELKKVLLHELGHALGLGGHSSNNHDVMFYGRAPTIAPALSKRDKNTINKLYSDYPTTKEAGSTADGKERN